MFLAIFECEIGDAGFVQFSEIFGDHAAVLGATAAKHCCCPVPLQLMEKAAKTSWHKPNGSHGSDIGVKIGLRFSPASLIAGFAA